MISKNRRSICSDEMGGSSIRRMTPLSRIIGGRPTFRCRSDPSCFITVRNSTLIFGSRFTSAGAFWTTSSSAVAIAHSSGLQPHVHAPPGQVPLGDGDRVLVVVEDARRQGRVGPGLKGIIQVLRL